MKQKLLLGIVVVLGVTAIALSAWTYVVTFGIARDMHAVTYSLKGPLDCGVSTGDITPETDRSEVWSSSIRHSSKPGGHTSTGWAMVIEYGRGYHSALQPLRPY